MPSRMTLALTASLLSIAAGLTMLLSAAKLYLDRSAFVEDAWPVQAKVVALDSGSVDGQRDRLYAILEFRTMKGEPVRLRVDQPVFGGELRIGESASVLYDPESPRDARLGRGAELWMATAIVGVFGGLLFLVPLCLLVRDRRQAARPRTL